MKNILYIATSDIHLKTFHIPYLDALVRNGNNVDLAFDDRGGITFGMARQEYRIKFPRTLHPSALRKSFLSLTRIIDDGDYDILHCHTPIPSALTRLAARKWRRRGGKLLYTAHGFHFYKGAPGKNWLIYYPAELLLSYFTDFIVTINSEDHAYTKNPFWGAPSAKIPGIGIQSHGFYPVTADEQSAIRKKLGFDPQDFILLYVAEFIPRKNHRFIIESAPDLRAAIPNIKVVFLGRGDNMEACKALTTDLGLQDTVLFKGFRRDVAKFAQLADVGISASKHEGLPIALLEEMMCAVPVIATDDRGHRELIENGRTGFIFQQNAKREFVEYVKRLYEDRALLKDMGAHAYEMAQKFRLSRSMREMEKIYERFL